jgi:hypothetical protein
MRSSYSVFQHCQRLTETLMIHVVGLSDRYRVRADLVSQPADLVERRDDVLALGLIEVTHACTVHVEFDTSPT